LTPLEILDFDYAAAEQYGQIRAALEKEGNPIGAYDLLIAAHARSLGVTLVTNNLSEFSRVSNIKLENWVSENH
jgi:tRNA(fMet)-specific endonuclease VapC